MKIRFAIALTILAGAALVAYFDRSSESEPAQPENASREPTSAAPGRTTQQFPAPPPRAQLEAATLGGPRNELRTACDEMYRRQQERRQRARDAEPKDPVWSYAMEQKLREYTSRRFQSTSIVISGIECKTTFCEISAQALVPEAAEEFSKAMEAIRGEPWSKFTGWDMTNSNDSGKQVQFARLSLQGSAVGPGDSPTPADEKLWAACASASNEEGQRKRAAMDAEPRDTSWADPMEQLLRQYLVEHTAKHPPDKLEITCRTTFCELKATGRTEAFALEFQKASQEVGSEPWGNLRNGEGGGGTLPDLSGMQMYQVLYRN